MKWEKQHHCKKKGEWKKLWRAEKEIKRFFVVVFGFFSSVFFLILTYCCFLNTHLNLYEWEKWLENCVRSVLYLYAQLGISVNDRSDSQQLDRGESRIALCLTGSLWLRSFFEQNFSRTLLYVLMSKSRNSWDLKYSYQLCLLWRRDSWNSLTVKTGDSEGRMCTS